MLERRRQSTTAIVQRQLHNIKISETVAGQKVTAPIWRAVAIVKAMQHDLGIARWQQHDHHG